MTLVQKVLIVNNDLINQVKKLYEKNDESIEKDVEILNEWLTKQPHLPQIKDNSLTERLLMRNKFRIEQSKKKIDAYYTLKGIYPDFFGASTVDINSSTIQNVYKSMYILLLKTPTPNAERIIFFKVKDPDPHSFLLLEIFQWIFLMLEIANKYDYCQSVRFIGDFEKFSLGFYKKLDPLVTYKAMKLLQEGFSHRISSVEYANTPGFVDLVIKLFQPLIKDGKIRTHTHIESLFNEIPQECFPDEYGGKAGKLQEIQDAWIEEFAAHKDYLSERIKLKSDESKRIDKSYYDAMFGNDGTFKKLNLD